MGLSKQVFSTGIRDPDGRGAAINYNRVIVVLPTGANAAQFAGDYFVLSGVVPPDPGRPSHAKRYCYVPKLAKTEPEVDSDNDASGGPGFTSCTGDPSCNGGPLPMKTAPLPEAEAEAAAPGITPNPKTADPDMTEMFVPGDCQILLKDSVTWSTDYPAYLCDPKSERAPFLVRRDTSNVGLDAWLKDYCTTVGLNPDELAFHFYETTLPLRLQPPASPVAGDPAERWLIAIPVLHANAGSKAAALAA